jgi:hypothetical protein
MLMIATKIIIVIAAVGGLSLVSAAAGIVPPQQGLIYNL